MSRIGMQIGLSRSSPRGAQCHCNRRARCQGSDGWASLAVAGVFERVVAMTRFVEGLAALADRYDAFFIDQFGVMHDGTLPYAGAVEAMRALTAAGRAVIVLTNSGKRAGPNIARIEQVGFARGTFTALMSSGEVTWQALRTGSLGPPFGAGRRLCVIGKAGEDYGLHDLDLILVDEPGDAEFIVIAGSDCPATSLDHYRAMLAPAAERHVPALCANPDRLMLTSKGLQPAPGAIARSLRGPRRPRDLRGQAPCRDLRPGPQGGGRRGGAGAVHRRQPRP